MLKISAWPLALVVTTDRLAINQAGAANACFVRIRPEYATDEGLLQHELEHVRQFWRLFWVGPAAFLALYLHDFLILAILSGLLCVSHSILYKFVPRYRLLAEVDAYKQQLKYYPLTRSHLFAHFIATEYGLDITDNDALDLLMD